MIFAFFLATAVAQASTCNLELVKTVPLKQDILGGLTRLSDDTVIVRRQNAPDFLFIEPNMENTHSLPFASFVVANPFELPDGRVGIGETNGRFMLVDHQAQVLSETLVDADGESIVNGIVEPEGTLLLYTAAGSLYRLHPDSLKFEFLTRFSGGIGKTGLKRIQDRIVAVLNVDEDEDQYVGLEIYDLAGKRVGQLSGFDLNTFQPAVDMGDRTILVGGRKVDSDKSGAEGLVLRVSLDDGHLVSSRLLDKTEYLLRAIALPGGGAIEVINDQFEPMKFRTRFDHLNAAGEVEHADVVEKTGFDLGWGETFLKNGLMLFPLGEQLTFFRDGAFQGVVASPLGSKGKADFVQDSTVELSDGRVALLGWENLHYVRPNCSN